MLKGFGESHPGPEEAFSPCLRCTPAMFPVEPVLHGRALRTASPGTEAQVPLTLLGVEDPVRFLPVPQQIRACLPQSQNEAHSDLWSHPLSAAIKSSRRQKGQRRNAMGQTGSGEGRALTTNPEAAGAVWLLSLSLSGRGSLLDRRSLWLAGHPGGAATLTVLQHTWP